TGPLGRGGTRAGVERLELAVATYECQPRAAPAARQVQTRGRAVRFRPTVRVWSHGRASPAERGAGTRPARQGPCLVTCTGSAAGQIDTARETVPTYQYRCTACGNDL